MGVHDLGDDTSCLRSIQVIDGRDTSTGCSTTDTTTITSTIDIMTIDHVIVVILLGSSMTTIDQRGTLGWHMHTTNTTTSDRSSDTREERGCGRGGRRHKASP